MAVAWTTSRAAMTPSSWVVAVATSCANAVGSPAVLNPACSRTALISFLLILLINCYNALVAALLPAAHAAPPHIPSPLGSALLGRTGVAGGSRCRGCWQPWLPVLAGAAQAQRAAAQWAGAAGATKAECWPGTASFAQSQAAAGMLPQRLQGLAVAVSQALAGRAAQAG